MTPYDVERKTFHDVMRLYSDLRAMQIRETTKTNDKNDGRVVRRPAGDDWF